MPKKPTSKRLDDLFEGIQDEQAKPPDKTKRKTSPRAGEKKPAISSDRPAATRPATRASALSQTKALPPLESVSVAQRGGAGTPSSLSLAFQMDSRNWATLQVVDDETVARDWNPDEQLLVKQVVDQLSQALENARLFQETRSRAEELSVLNEMGRELTNLFSVETIAETIYKYASRLMDTTNLFVTLYDETKQEITPIYVINNRERAQVPTRKLGNGLTDHILRTHEPLFIPDDVPSQMKKLGIEVITLGNNRLAQCWMGAPLLVGNSVLGVVGLQNTDSPNIFTERHRDLLTAICGQAAIAIQNARLFEETQRHTKELDALNQLNQKLSAQLNVDQVLQEIYHGAENLIDAKNFYIGLYSPEKNETSFLLNVSESVVDRTIVTLPADKGLTGYVLRARKPILISENVTEAMQKMGIEVVGEPAKCWLGVPLLLGEQVIGVMAAQSYTEANFYDEHDRDLLMAVAGQAAISIQNARLYQSTVRTADRFAVLNESSYQISSSLDPEQVYVAVHKAAERLMLFDAFVLTLLDEEKNEIDFVYVFDRGVRGIQKRVPFGSGLSSEVIRHGKPLLMNTIEEINSIIHEKHIDKLTLATFSDNTEIQSIVAVPMNLGNKTLGALSVQSYQPGAYTEEDVQIMGTLANQAVIAIQNGSLFAETQRRVTELSTLNDISRELASALRPEELYRLVHQQMSRLFETTSFFIGTYETGSDHWDMAYQIENGQPAELLGPRDLKAGLSSYMIRTRQPLLLNSAREVEDFHQSLGLPQIGMAGSKSWIGVPLIATGQVVGVMAIQNYQQENLFSNQDLALFSTIAAQVAIALQNARLFTETRQRAQALEAINEVGSAITSVLDLEGVLGQMVDTIKERFGHYFVGLSLIEEGRLRFKVGSTIGNSPLKFTRVNFDLTDGLGLIAEAARTNQLVVVNDVSTDPRYMLVPELPDTRSEITVPISLKGRVIGVLDAQSDKINAYDQDSMTVLQSLANQAGAAIDNARLFQDTERRAEEMATLNDLGRVLTSQINLDQVLDEVYKGVSRILDTTNFYIAIYDEPSQEIIFPYNVSESQVDREITRLPVDQGLTSYIIRNRESILLKGEASEWLAEHGIESVGEPSQCWLGVPLLIGEQTLGAIAVQNYTNPDAFSEHDRYLLTAISNQAAIAIQNARLFETEQARRQEAETLYNASRIIAAARNEEEIFAGVVENLDHANVDRILIAIAEEYSGELWAQVKGAWDRDGNEALYIGNRYSAKQIPAMKQTFAGDIIRVDDFNTSTEIDEVTRSTYQHLGIKSALVIPIRGQATQGWIQLLTTSAPRTFRDEDIRSYLTLAQQIAIALESLQNAAGLALVNRIVSALTMATSLEDSLSVVVHEIVEGFPVVRGAITLLDEDKQGFTVIADHSKLANSPSVVGLKIPLEGNIATQTLVSTCKPYIVEDASNNPVNPPALQEEARRIGINYTAIFPISHNNEVIGTLGVDIAAENAILNKKQISLLEAALSPISAAIERLRAEGLLARSEADLRALFASMHDIIIVYDNQGRYVRIAPTNPERLIRPPDELIGKTIYEAVPAELHQPFMEAIQRALGGEQDVRLEYPLRIEEQEYWFEASVSPLNSTEVFWVARDITGRKRVEEVLRASEDRFRSILDNIEDGYYEVDTAGNLTFFNPALVRLLGRPANELIGLNNRMFMPASGVKSVFQTYNRVFKTGIPEQAFNWDVVRPDGTLRAVEASVSPIKVADGSIAGFRGTVRDITDRKKAEETLRRNNEYLSATAEIGQLVTSTLDMPTLFSRTVNLVRDRFRFYHASIFVTEETGFRTILQAATGEAGAEMMRQKHSLQVGSKSIVGEVAESGRSIVVNDTVASETHKFNPLLPETHAETAIPLRVGTRTIGVLDIQSTSPNAFSEDDIAVLQILADQVAIAIDNARSYELSMQAVKEMREADRLKSQFLANMSHELRTPLNSIIGFSRVILKGIDGAITDLQQQDLLAIHNSGQHLLGLINDILDVSRIEAGKMELTFDEVNLPDLITSVMSTASGLVKDKPITLHRNLPANLPSVRADVMRIRQVLLNLLSNAAKFTDEGTITVQASVADNPTGHPEVTISVTDTGPGISQEDQKKLFQPFSQVDASPTRKSGGSGLGLSISSHLVQMHGGHIGVESTPEKGSTFYFTLPAFRGKPETDAPQGKRIILAIDDDPQVISLYERYLQPQGYQVVSLSDPSRAAERVRQLKPFAITLDIMMPGYDGWHVLNDLKSNPETRDVPVVVCSIVDEQEKGFNLGAADYLVKPILEDEILNSLDRLNINGNIREVLIVDDDPNDLRLMGRMLSEQGRYHPMLAEGGRAGWETIQARTPHAVILDLFMPELDGFTILERMRSTEKLRDIPVIVVSGGGLTSVQEQQLQDFGQRMIQKSALTGKQLVEMLEHTLQQVKK